MINPLNSQPEEHNAHPAYRPDIDGLRAIAILSVVIFHAFPTFLQGGFVGVDIFFVISGFLISSIIFRSLKEGNFRFIEFYAHRIKRIFPSLIVVLAACYAFGWFVLFPDEFMQLGKHIAAGAGFVQNFILWQETGYFDTAAELKPLLHLWSLAIEEQFYLIYPALIFFAWRNGLIVLKLVVFVCLISLLLNISEVHKDPTATFFFPQTRFWELLAGSILAYLQLFNREKFFAWMKRWAFHPFLFRHSLQANRRDAVLNDILSVVGLSLLVVAVLFINRNKLFPGWLALLPVSGAFLLILSGPYAWANRVILANRLMVFVGLISYPLYLWHWPLLSFARIVESEVPSWEIRMAAVLLSFVLAWLSYILVEKPIRFGKKTWLKTGGLVMVLIVVGYVGYNSFERNGLGFRGSIKPYQSKINDLSWNVSNLGYLKCDEKTINAPPSLNFCLFSKNSISPEMAVFGDSHADHLFYGLASSDSANWMLIGNSSCPPVTGIHVIADVKNCDVLVAKGLNYIVNSKTIRTVVLSFFGSYILDSSYAADHVAANSGPATIKITSDESSASSKPELFFIGLDRTISILEKSHKSVVIVIDIPELPFFPKACVGRPLSGKVNKCIVPISAVYERQAMQRGLINKIKIAHPAIRVYDPLRTFCDLDYCYIDKNNELMYRDSHHLSLRGSSGYALNFLKWLRAE